MKISVIIPAYNAGKHIKMALDAILGQSLSDMEVIIVNDGSTDNTQEMAQRGLPYNLSNNGLTQNANEMLLLIQIVLLTE